MNYLKKFEHWWGESYTVPWLDKACHCKTNRDEHCNALYQIKSFEQLVGKA